MLCYGLEADTKWVRLDRKSRYGIYQRRHLRSKEFIRGPEILSRKAVDLNIHPRILCGQTWLTTDEKKTEKFCRAFPLENISIKDANVEDCTPLPRFVTLFKRGCTEWVRWDRWLSRHCLLVWVGGVSLSIQLLKIAWWWSRKQRGC